AIGSDRDDGTDGLSSYPSLRADRKLRPVDGVRLAGAVGRAAGGGAGGAHGSPGCRLSDPRSSARRRSGNDDRCSCGWQHDGRAGIAQQHPDEGISQEPGGDRGGLCGWLVSYRRSRSPPSRRLCRDQRPVEGHHHLGRRKHLVARGRGHAISPSANPRGGGGCQTRPPLGRDPVRFRDAQAGCRFALGCGYNRVVPCQPRALQSAASRGLRDIAEDLDGKDPEIRAARARQGTPVNELPSFDLQGQVALVTGASSGIGRHLAALLAAAGATVALAARRADRLAEAAREIEAAGGRCLPIALDVTRSESVAAAVAAAEGEPGPLTIPVHNAGVTVAKPVLQHTEEEWDYVLDTNLKGAWLMAREFAQHLVDRGRPGRIINIASVLGVRTIAWVPSYTAAKAGLIHLTGVLAMELARHGILVNAIAPGYVETDFNRDFQ